MSKVIIYPKIKTSKGIQDVSYGTEYSAILNKPPISYDVTKSMTKVNSKFHSNGDITTSGKVYNSVWNDYAELFEKGEDVNPGDVVCYNPEDGKIYKSSKRNDKLVVGVVSDTYGTLLGGDADKSLEENLVKYAPVGLSGRVYVNVDRSEIILPGDFLTSSLEGTAWSYYKTGCVIGKALSKIDNGKVLMLIMLG